VKDARECCREVHKYNCSVWQVPKLCTDSHALKIDRVIQHPTTLNKASLPTVHGVLRKMLHRRRDGRGDNFAISVCQAKWTDIFWRPRNNYVVHWVIAFRNEYHQGFKKIHWWATSIPDSTIDLKKNTRSNLVTE
jgi:hypothetical protein